MPTILELAGLLERFYTDICADVGLGRWLLLSGEVDYWRLSVPNLKKNPSALKAMRRDARKTVIMTHVPPYDSGLDTAPLLSPTLQPTVSAGDVLRGPVGSTGVRKAIESFRPVLGVHGHIHESGGERRIGGTLCVNAGSEANHGVLRGYLIDLTSDGVERTLRVEG